MKTRVTMMALLAIFTLNSCKKEISTEMATKMETQVEKPDYFLLRPEVEKLYGNSHAVKIGNDIKISGAVSMDDKGNLTATGNMEQQMKNC
jgi:2-iminobutanoate/2-iminopropanoate deaminase